jgi:hypothetical protein
VGIWPGQSREYLRDDWEVGYRDRHGGHHKLVRVRNADRDKVYAYYQWLCDRDMIAIMTIGPLISSAAMGLLGKIVKTQTR